MRVRVNIEVTSDRYGEELIDVGVTEVFTLVYRRPDESHSDREQIRSRVEEMLMFAGIKNTGRHGG